MVTNVMAARALNFVSARRQAAAQKHALIMMKWTTWQTPPVPAPSSIEKRVEH